MDELRAEMREFAEDIKLFRSQFYSMDEETIRRRDKGFKELAAKEYKLRLDIEEKEKEIDDVLDRGMLIFSQ